jgi:putative membrane protein
MNPSTFFSHADLEAIRRATGEAEQRTSGEIVPVVVGACDDYEEASWKAAAFGALAVSCLVAIVHGVGGFWLDPPWLWILGPPAIGAATGYLLGRILPAFRRAMISPDTLDLRVQRRARQAFLEEEVFATRERTGILIFLALFERRVVVLGDEAINRAVEQSEWQDIVDHLIKGIRSGRPGPALVDSIGECGLLLEKHGVEIRPDDIDELANGLRMEDR